MPATRSEKHRPHLSAIKGPSAAPRPARLTRQQSEPVDAQIQATLPLVNLIPPPPSLPFALCPLSPLSAPPPLSSPSSPSSTVEPSIPRGEKRSASDVSLRCMSLEAKRHRNNGLKPAPRLKVLEAYNKMMLERLHRSIRRLKEEPIRPTRPYRRNRKAFVERRFERKVEERRLRDIERQKPWNGLLTSSLPDNQPIALDDDLIYAVDPITLDTISSFPRAWGYNAMRQHLAFIGRLDLTAQLESPDCGLLDDIVMDEAGDGAIPPIGNATVFEDPTNNSVNVSAKSGNASTPGGTSTRSSTMDLDSAVAAPGSSLPSSSATLMPATGAAEQRSEPVPSKSPWENSTTPQVVLSDPSTTTLPASPPPPSHSPSPTSASNAMTEADVQARLEKLAASPSTSQPMPKVLAPRRAPTTTPAPIPFPTSAQVQPMTGTTPGQAIPTQQTSPTAAGAPEDKKAVPPPNTSAPPPANDANPPARKVKALSRSAQARINPPVPSSTATPTSAVPSGSCASIQLALPTPQPVTTSAGASGSGSSKDRSLVRTKGASGSESFRPKAASEPSAPPTGQVDRKGKGKTLEQPDHLKLLIEAGLDIDDEEEEAQNRDHSFRSTSRTAKGGGGGLLRSRR